MRSFDAFYARLRAFPPQALLGPAFYAGLAERRTIVFRVTPVYGRPPRDINAPSAASHAQEARERA